MKEPKYYEGPAARKAFEQGMAKLFRAPKTVATKPPKEAKPKPQKSGKD